ncbi:hypothetical protein VY487_001670 [Salmonella enterica]|nr:hypothetical protein [Salmonella enterica]EKO0902522.1 hypothetical protein [Salmonella enterica subsp. enterica]EHK3516108.1 hypothetical protein [Salmonella enterica]EIF0661168.1 hypothetical protein [Salmonella enterica]EJI4684059.1 hypothetical protein [Salmonella enterica]
MIITNSQYLGSPVADVSQFAGLFGSLPVGEMPVCADANTALIGWEKVTPSTKNHPNAGMQYGILRTIDTLGCGQDGKRRVPVNTVQQEWVYQMALMTNGAVLMRQRINRGNWSGWVRWF